MPTISSQSAPSAVIPSLDGIRAIAVALVFFAHSGLDNIIPGGLGVTIFFVLSGYLISTLLRMEYAATGTVDYRGFYLRRLLRLMPPLTVVVALVFLLAALALVDNFSTPGLLSVLFYFGNYYAIAQDFHGLPDGMGVVWSLAVEEHYYLLYPPLAAVLLRIGRAGVSASWLLTLCALVLGWRCWLALQGVSETYIGMATDTRIDAILIGCLLALWRNPWLDPPRPNAVRDFALFAIAFATLLFTLLYRDDFFRLTFRYALQSGAVAVLLYFAIARAQTWPFRWLNSRPLIYIGGISYTVYLSHHVIMQLLARNWPRLSWFAATGLAVMLTWAVAEPMRRWVELPCARLRKRLHGRNRKFNNSPNTTLPVSSQVAPGGML